MSLIHKFIFASIIAAGSTAAATQGYSGPSMPPAATPASSYAGPSAVPTMTVKQLLAKGADDQYVTLAGKLVRHTGGKYYVFADASGEIKVEIPSQYFPVGRTIDANTQVQLTGKFDKESFGTSEVEVKQVILAN